MLYVKSVSLSRAVASISIQMGDTPPSPSLSPFLPLLPLSPDLLLRCPFLPLPFSPPPALPSSLSLPSPMIQLEGLWERCKV